MPNDKNHAPGSPLQAKPPAGGDPIEPQDPHDVRQELKQAIAGSNDILTTARTTMSLFPDTLTVDRAKVTETKRTFIQTAEVMSINIEDILNVTATVGPLFGTVKIVSRVMGNTEKPFTLGLFWRKDTLRIKRILHGYVIALQRGIDCSSLPTRELVKMLDDLGQDDHQTA